ncbi:YsnF/AvaK domain-containing protein [Planococcus sp. N028]|uniref:YsnF/AvaK domain-containing protein n=1 Tax=Planococcus shixiaomingii TaxID=3058393 RepID=A0ABT8N317_9BACL|nr:YsnF/AvaK domain-containing protein [Planococcus sp. N028]MDN7242138.1 YsnF/AvaK domain-containing protein [Planococcus sp. N028]
MARKDNTFIGVFDTQAEVLSKVTELKAQGYNETDMYVVGQDNDSFSMVQNQTDVHVDTAGEQQDQGFMGKFMSALSGESSSMEAFNGMGLDRDESEEYYRQVQNGKLVLYVDSDYGDSYNRYSEGYSNSSGTGSTFASGTSSTDTRNSFGSSSSDRDNTFGSSTTDRDSTFGSTGSTSGTTGATNNTFGSSTDSTTDEERLRLHEERLNVDKERVQTGEVNVGKRVVEENQSIEVPVEREEVYVERRPVNEEASDVDAFKDTNDTIHVPVSEERVNVSKKNVVSEEIVVGKQKVQDTETVSETVRREEADIDEDSNLTNNRDRDSKLTDKFDRDNDNNNKPF